jgi:L-alanine-DL-glutamate epimerase-like enolase superfamily enzyme
VRLSSTILELYPAHAFNIAREASHARRDVWVRLRLADGREGWGEAAATPYYGETAESVMAVLPRLGEALGEAAGGDPLALERADAAVEAAAPGNHAAKAALSAAMHDLAGKAAGLPVWKMWGLDPAAAPRSSFTIGIDRPEVMRERILEAASYPILKIKIGTPDDKRILRTVREAAPDRVIRVDANTGWTLDQAIAALPMLTDFGIELIEQPLPPDDLDGLRALRQKSSIPIIADESCRTLSDVPRLVGVVDGINIKMAKCGSLREAIRMIHCARAHEMSVMIGCMLESTLGVAAAVQLAPLADYVDLDGAALLANDPFNGPGLGPDGSLRFNDEPGLGVTRSDLNVR